MMGWIVMIAFGLATFVALTYFGKLPRGIWEAAAAAIVLAAAGYAWQGSPGLAGSPAKQLTDKGSTAEALIQTRSEMDQTFSNARPYLILSDAYARDGDYQFAASYIRSGIRKHPQNADLWAGLGLQLMLAGEGQMSPPAKFAFDRAKKLAPRQPAPDYFEGLAALFEGRIDVAIGLWQGLLDTAPKEAKWKGRLESQVADLKKLQASTRKPPSS
jgi:cytochrome c-type biogenesis protein CcmH/NrfG